MWEVTSVKEKQGVSPIHVATSPCETKADSASNGPSQHTFVKSLHHRQSTPQTVFLRVGPGTQVSKEPWSQSADLKTRSWGRECENAPLLHWAFMRFRGPQALNDKLRDRFMALASDASKTQLRLRRN